MSKEKKISIIVIAVIIIVLFPIIVLAEGAQTYTVSFSSMGGSSVGDVTVKSGSAIDKPEDPANPGHVLAGWYKEEECINEWNFKTDIVTADITLFAAWKDLYTISASAADPSMGYVSGGGGYAGGTAVTLYATPKDGYRFFSSVSASAEPEIAAPVISAPVGGYRSVMFSWEAVPGASGYEIYRSTLRSGSYLKVCTLKYPEATSYTGYDLISDKVYYYKVRAYSTVDYNTCYSDYSVIQPVKASIAAPVLSAASASRTSIQLTWNALPGVSGYELYRSTSLNGRYKKIYAGKSASSVIYTNKGLKRGTTYYYKIRAYGKQGSKKIYGGYSQAVSAYPSKSIIERRFTILYQSDPQWGFPTEVRKKACLMCSYAITINNMGIKTNPKTFYESNGYTTYVSLDSLAENFGVKAVCAVDFCAPYLESYEGFGTYIKAPSQNAETAIKEALNRHPEGVICYFKKGKAAHAIVACRYDGDTIYYSDPGRSRKTLLTFGSTWVWYHHRMNYGNLSYIVALDKIGEA